MIFPLMPEGVEHSIHCYLLFRYSIMIFPLMPEGVEHIIRDKITYLYRVHDFSSDAGRR